MTDGPRIRLARPSLSSGELSAVEHVFASLHLAQGPEVGALEAEVSTLLDGRRVVAVSSGGSALLAALAAAGIGPGDEVVVPAFTFPAAAQAVFFLGATPVPADVDVATLGVSAATVAPRLSQRTRAVVAAHAFGIPADVEGISRLLEGTGIPLIEDAACSIGGATPGGAPSGSHGRFGCFSLHPRKLATCGEGGLIACAPEDEAALRTLRDYGRTGTGFGDIFGGLGLNLRMSDVAASIARVQVAGVAASIARRASIARAYRERLTGVTIPAGIGAPGCTYQSFVATSDLSAEVVVAALRSRDIEAGPAAYDLCGQTFYRTRVPAGPECPVSAWLARTCFALPLHDALDDDAIERVCAEVARVAGPGGTARQAGG